MSLIINKFVSCTNVWQTWSRALQAYTRQANNASSTLHSAVCSGFSISNRNDLEYCYILIAGESKWTCKGKIDKHYKGLNIHNGQNEK